VALNLGDNPLRFKARYRSVEVKEAIGKVPDARLFALPGFLLSLFILPACLSDSPADDLEVERRFGFYTTWVDDSTDVWMGQRTAGLRISGYGNGTIWSALPPCQDNGSVEIWLRKGSTDFTLFGLFDLTIEWTSIASLQVDGSLDVFLKVNQRGCQPDGDERPLFAAIEVKFE
jgi:hypothetical protein